MVNLLVLPFTYVFLASSHGVDIKNSTMLLWCWTADGKGFVSFLLQVGHQDHTFSYVDMFWA